MTADPSRSSPEREGWLSCKANGVFMSLRLLIYKTEIMHNIYLKRLLHIIVK